MPQYVRYGYTIVLYIVFSVWIDNTCLALAMIPIIFDIFVEMWSICFLQESWSSILIFIIWLAPRAGKMSQILRCDWLPERARWSYLARSGLPVALPLGIESLIPTTMQSFLRFSRCFRGKDSLKSSVNFLNIYLKERKENGIVLV